MKQHSWLQSGVDKARGKEKDSARSGQKRGSALFPEGGNGALEVMLIDEKVEVESGPGFPNPRPRPGLGKLYTIESIPPTIHEPWARHTWKHDPQEALEVQQENSDSLGG